MDSLTVSNCILRRVLVDGRSSANIIFQNALEGMGRCDKDITKKSTILVGLSGEAQQTVGEFVVPTLAKSFTLQTRFDCPSAYNIILGTPWILKMIAVPSTYHQKLKFFTMWVSRNSLENVIVRC